MGTVPMVVNWVTITMPRTNPILIVHIPIAIVIHAVIRNLIGIGPHIGRQIIVGVAHPGIDHCNNDILRTGGQVPGIGDIGICARNSPSLSIVIQPPQPTIGKPSI